MVDINEDIAGGKEVDDGVLVCWEGPIEERAELDGFSRSKGPYFVGWIIDTNAVR